MPLISQYNSQTSSADTDLFLFEVAGGTYRNITFANLAATILSGTTGTGNMIYGGLTPVTPGSVPSFSDTTGFNYDEGYDVGASLGDLLQIIDVGGLTPGLPALDGSNLTGLVVPELDDKINSPGVVVGGGSAVLFLGSSGVDTTQGPFFGEDIGNAVILHDINGNAGFLALDGSMLINLPNIGITTPGTTVIGNITTWGDTGGGDLDDSGIAVSQITTNATNIGTNVTNIGTNATNIATNVTDITNKLDKSPIDGNFYGQVNGVIFIPDTSEIPPSTNRNYVDDADVLKIANLPLDTAFEIGLRQLRSPVDGISYVLLNGTITGVTIALIPGLQTELDSKVEEAPIDGTPYSRQDAGWVTAGVGAGDVVGPISSIDGQIALFDGITGKLLNNTGPNFGVAIGDAIILVDVSSNPALPAVDGSLLTNLPIPVSSTLQSAYNASVQPLIATNLANGGFRVQEGVTDTSGLLFEGTNVSSTSVFSVDILGDILANTYNGVALTTGGSLNSFLTFNGTYETLDLNQNYFFSTGTTNANPGNQFFRYNNVSPTLVTELYISKNQIGFIDIGSKLLALATGDTLAFVERELAGRSHLYTVDGIASDQSTYVLVPVTFTDGSSLLFDPTNAQIDLEIDSRPSILSRVNLEASSKIVGGGVLTVDAPGVPPGESFSATTGVATIITSPGIELIVDFGPFDGVLFTEPNETAFLFINTSGLLVQIETPIPDDFRTKALLGFVARSAATGQLTGTAKFLDTAYQNWAQFSDLAIFVSGAADASARIDNNGANTSFQRFEGEGFVFLANAINDINNPHLISMTAANPTPFRVYLFSGVIEAVIYSGLGTDTLVDPTVYDDLSGSLIPIPGSGNQAQIIRVFWQPNTATGAEIRFIHGQVLFANMADAVNALSTYFPTIPSAVISGAIDLGGIVCRKGAVDFTSSTDAIFFRRSQITGGGGGSVQQSLQDTYQNSLQPQITTAIGDGSVQFKDGQGDDTAEILEVLDQSGFNVALAVTGGGIKTARGFSPSNTGVIFMDGPVTQFSPTEITIPIVQGLITNSHDYVIETETITVITNGFAAFTVPGLATDPATFFFVNNLGVVSTQNTPPTASERRAGVYFVQTLNNNTTSEIFAIINIPTVSGITAETQTDFVDFIGSLETGGAVQQTSDTGTNGLLAFSIGALDLFLSAVNWHTDNTSPNLITIAAVDPGIFLYMLRTGEISSTGNAIIDPTIYDVAGVETPVPNPAATTTIQYVWRLVGGEVVVVLGQFTYSDLATAFDNLDLDKEIREVPAFLQGFGSELAAIIIQKNSLDLSDITTAIIIQDAKVGGSGGGGGSTSFKGLSDTPNVTGAENSLLTWDATSALQNTDFIAEVFNLGIRIANTTLAIDAPTYLGTAVNPLNTALLGTTVIGSGSLTLVTTGNDITTLGIDAFSAATNVVDSTAVGKSLGTAITDAVNVHLFGQNIAGPAGIIGNYLNIQQVIQADLGGSGSVTIGDPINTKPSTVNTHNSLALNATDRVLNLNVLDNTQQTAISSALIDGDLWYNSTTDEVTSFANGVIAPIGGGGGGASAGPKGYISWRNGFVRTSTTVLTLTAPIYATSSDGTTNIELESDQTLNNTLSGAGGLDTGTITDRAFYDIYLISDSTEVNPTSAILSLRATGSPTIPAGYDKAALIFTTPTDDSSEFIAQTVTPTGGSIWIKYDLDLDDVKIVNSSEPTSFTDVSINNVFTKNLNFGPPGMRCRVEVSGRMGGISANIAWFVRDKGFVNDGASAVRPDENATSDGNYTNAFTTADASGIFQFKTDNAVIDFDMHIIAIEYIIGA